ncbi:MAG TPA: DUF4351 domain-containing protein [Blastocatellia bacterium]|nr:DUF4351 domain-containing protein [Blastocatellia bacterium]
MAKRADISSKRLISLDPNAWARWITARRDLVVREIVSAEFQFVSRESDTLMRVASPREGEFLLLNEVQLRYNDRVPRRVNAYSALAMEKFELPVYPVLLNLLPPPEGTVIEPRYQSVFMGLETRQDFRVVNLWETDVEIIFREHLPGLLPLAPVMRGGSDETIIRQALKTLRDEQQPEELETVLALFASFVMDVDLIRQIMRWDMAVIREAPWYQEAMREGLVQGIQKGMEQGEQIGSQRLLLRLLRLRFGDEAESVRTELSGLSVEQMERLMDEALTVASLDEFVRRIHLLN